MSQVYPWDRGTNYAVEIGRRVGRLVDSYLAANTSLGKSTATANKT
jgi:hypothetical protein